VPERVLRGRMAGLRTFAPPLKIPGFSVHALWHQRVHHDSAYRWLREQLALSVHTLRAVAERREK
jgi:DNA-binding transcriptional LysR family regulator